MSKSYKQHTKAHTKGWTPALTSILTKLADEYPGASDDIMTRMEHMAAEQIRQNEENNRNAMEKSPKLSMGSVLRSIFRAPNTRRQVDTPFPFETDLNAMQDIVEHNSDLMRTAIRGYIHENRINITALNLTKEEYSDLLETKSKPQDSLKLR